MYRVDPDEAKARLLDLMDAAIRGETVVIARDDQLAVQLVPVSSPHGRRRAGTAKGKFTMSDDFDDPLSDFDGYSA